MKIFSLEKPMMTIEACNSSFRGTKMATGKARKQADWHEFAAGGGAAFVNIMCMYPAYKLILRQQVDGIPVAHAFKQLQVEGIMRLYRGVGPPLIMKAAGLSVMFGSYGTFQRILSQRYPGWNQFVVQATAAMVAGTIEAIFTPLERVQTLLVLSEHKDFARVENTVHAFLKIYKHYNFKEYYRGFTAILARNGPSSVCFFTLREPIKNTLPTVNKRYQDVIEDFVSGAVLGATISTVFYPLNVIKSNMQKRLGQDYKSILQTFEYVYERRGQSFRRMFFGVSINFTRSLISWGIINASYEFLKKFLQDYC